jgi:hypothetical protein
MEIIQAGSLILTLILDQEFLKIILIAKINPVQT